MNPEQIDRELSEIECSLAILEMKIRQGTLVYSAINLGLDDDSQEEI